MHIRYANLADLDFLLAGIEKNRIMERRPPACVKARQEDILEFKGSIKKKHVRIVEDKGKPVAFLHFKTNFNVMYVNDRFFWIDLVYVKEGCRRKGLGKMLYQDAARIAKQLGFKKMLIDIFEANKQSKAFHKRLGFKPVYTIYEQKI